MSDMQPPSLTQQEVDPARAVRKTRLVVLAVWVLTGVLAVVAISLVISSRLEDSTRTTGNASCGSTGPFGNVPISDVASGNSPTAAIAVSLVSQAFSFTPQDFEKQVAAAKRRMTGEMALKYDGLIAAERVKQQIDLGLIVKTSLLHLANNPKNVAFVGVSCVAPNEGRFLMVMQRSVTTAGSTRAQVNTFMLSVGIQKIGNIWVLSSVA